MATKPIQQSDIYQLAEEFSDTIWYAYDGWNFKAQQTIGLQVTRSSDSIAANLAEGFGRFIPKDRRKFYPYARGSFEETKAWLAKPLGEKLFPKSLKINFHSSLMN